MREKIDCFLPDIESASFQNTVKVLNDDKLVQYVIIMDGENGEIDNSLASTETILKIEKKTDADYVLLCSKKTQLTLGQNSLERMFRVAEDMDAAMVYSDHYSMIEGQLVKHPVIDYQQGSVRDDFDFGALWLVKTAWLHEWACAHHEMQSLQYAALYDLRLFLSRKGQIFHINEYLYTEQELDTRKSGEKMFDYVNPRNREVQIEMEKVVTEHLDELGALIDTNYYRQPDFDEQNFTYEASVII